jgi:hypothetical protein
MNMPLTSRTGRTKDFLAACASPCAFGYLRVREHWFTEPDEGFERSGLEREAQRAVTKERVSVARFHLWEECVNLLIVAATLASILAAVISLPDVRSSSGRFAAGSGKTPDLVRHLSDAAEAVRVTQARTNIVDEGSLAGRSLTRDSTTHLKEPVLFHAPAQ